MIDRIILTIAFVASAAAAPLAAQSNDADYLDTEATPARSSAGNEDPLGLGELGEGRPADAQTVITARKQATFNNQSGIATFEGKVLVKDPQITLMCEKLTVYLDEERKGMERAEADGNVIIVHEGEGQEPVKSIARSQKAIYTPKNGDILLLVWPQIQQGINNHISTEEGTKMRLNREGRLNTDGSSKTVIVDTSAPQPQY